MINVQFLSYVQTNGIYYSCEVSNFHKDFKEQVLMNIFSMLSICNFYCSIIDLCTSIRMPKNYFNFILLK